MKNLTVLKKAYEINFDKIKDGFLASEIYCYAESRNEAKYKLLNGIQYDDWILEYNNKPINYINIPVLRKKEFDLVEYEGKQIKRCDIDKILNKRKKYDELDEILDNQNIKFCYIYKHGGFYRPNSCGYTQYQYKAGVYEKYDAVSRAKSCDDLRIIPINIEEHNNLIQSEIEILKKNLINN